MKSHNYLLFHFTAINVIYYEMFFFTFSQWLTLARNRTLNVETTHSVWLKRAASTDVSVKVATKVMEKAVQTLMSVKKLGSLKMNAIKMQSASTLREGKII